MHSNSSPNSRSRWWLCQGSWKSSSWKWRSRHDQNTFEVLRRHCERECCQHPSYLC